MGKILNAFQSGIKSTTGQAELAQFHMKFNQFLVNNPNSYAQGTDDAGEMLAYSNGNIAWINIALNRKMLDISNVEFFFVDENGERIDDKDVPDEIITPFTAGFAGLGINELMARAGGHEDLSGNALWLKDTKLNRYTQLANIDSQFIPITPGMFKINLNSRGTAVDNFCVRWKDGTESIVPPDRVIQFKRNSLISPFMGIGLISQGRALVENDVVSTQYQNNFMEKDGTPDLIYLDKDAKGMQPNMIKAKGDQLRAEYKAGKYSNSIMYAPGDVDIKAFSISSSDLQYVENRKMNSEQVISLMESTGTVLGIPDANNKASAGTLTNAYFGIVNSRVDHLVDTVNKQFVWTIKGNETKKISWSYQSYPTGDIDTVNKSVQGGLMSPNEGAKAMGYPTDKKNEAANSLYVGAGLRTLDYAFNTEPMSFGGGLSAPDGSVKKKTMIRDYRILLSDQNHG